MSGMYLEFGSYSNSLHLFVFNWTLRNFLLKNIPDQNVWNVQAQRITFYS